VLHRSHRVDDLHKVDPDSYLGNISPKDYETLWPSAHSIPQLAQPRLETAGTD